MFTRLLADFSRWLFLGTLLYAPWAYGCTEPEAITALNGLLTAVLLLYALGLALRAQWPPVARWLAALTLGLLILGWGMTLNAHYLYDAFFNQVVDLPGTFQRLPGSVERALSIAAMIRVTTCLGCVIFVADLVRRPLWQMRLWWTLGLAGGSIALLGLAQKLTNAPMIFWAPSDIPKLSFFATYYYHANGGAFLNLVLPPIACLALRAISREDDPGGRVLWSAALLVVIASEAVHTSRGAQVVALLLGVAILAWPARALLAGAWQANRRSSAAALCFGLIAAAAVIFSNGVQTPIDRWRQLFDPNEHLTDGGRLLVAGAGLRVVPSAGWFGFGPGTFRVVFPYFTGYLGKKVPGIWNYLHEDYIQTAIEWGGVGAALWTLLYFGGVVNAVRAYSRHARFWTGRQRLLLAGAVLALAGTALHSLVDFPLQIASLQLYCAVYLGICWSSLGWVAAPITPRVTAAGAPAGSA